GAGGCRQGVARTAGGAKPPGGSPVSTHKAVSRTHQAGSHPTGQPSARPPGSHPAPSPTSPSAIPQPTRSSAAPTSPNPVPTTTPPGTSPKPSPSPTSSPTSSPAPESVQVSYTLVRQHPHSFQGKFTIVNTGTTAVSGWELAVVLPNDDVRSVWDGSFHT